MCVCVCGGGGGALRGGLNVTACVMSYTDG